MFQVATGSPRLTEYGVNNSQYRLLNVVYACTKTFPYSISVGRRFFLTYLHWISVYNTCLSTYTLTLLYAYTYIVVLIIWPNVTKRKTISFTHVLCAISETLLLVDKQTEHVSTNIHVDYSLFSGDGMLVQGPEYYEYVDHLVHLCTFVYSHVRSTQRQVYSYCTHVLYLPYYSIFMSMYKYVIVHNEHFFII